MTSTRFIVDADLCSNCSLCVVACKDEHSGSAHEPWTKAQPEVGHFWVDVLVKEQGTLPRLKMSYLPVFCQHCADAPCASSCPTGAIKRRPDGLTYIDPTLCNGCGDCLSACPYDVIYMNADEGIAQKCTGCAHRVDVGLPPRCAEICPHDAIQYLPDGEVYEHTGDSLEALRPDLDTRPSVKWKNLPRPRLCGIVIDEESDDVIAGARVEAIELQSGDKAAIATDPFGEFRLERLSADKHYQVCIVADGYEPLVVEADPSLTADLGNILLKRRADFGISL